MRIWSPRKSKDVIGRIVSANPCKDGMYFLRVLLNHIRGPKSFENLKTVDGIVLSTSCEVALLHDLLSRNSYSICVYLKQLLTKCLYQCNDFLPMY